ncbi:MAG: phosphatase PAP2 family protein [Candidatus Dormibacteraceae bacterium]
MSALVGSARSAEVTSSAKIRRPLLVLGLAAMALFGADTIAAANTHYLSLDVPIAQFIQSINWGPLVWVFKRLDEIEGTRQQLVAVAGILLIAAVNWRAAPLAIVTALSGGIYTITAMVINRPRPSADLVHVIHHTGASSYPSGHVAFFSWFLVMLILCLAVGRLPRPVVALLWVAAALLLLAVCIGRVYLGEHWPSDVVGGLALGFGWMFLALSWRWISNPVLARAK